MAKRYYDYETLCEGMHDVVLKNGALHRCIDAGMILELPQADVVEAKRGIWFPRNSGFQKWFRCSECAYRLYELKGTKFCPNCGADMREV